MDDAALRRAAASWLGHQLSPAEMLTLQLLLTGALAPRSGYPDETPLVVRTQPTVGTTLALRDDEGATIAALSVTSVRPGDDATWLVSGDVRPVEGIVHSDFQKYRQTPEDLRKLAAEHGWERVLAYQPRHVVTQEDADALVTLARSLDAALLLQPLHGPHIVGDLEWYAIARCAVLTGEILAEELGEDRFALVLTPDPGTRASAARVAANYGATHLALDAADAEVHDPGLDVRRLPLTPTATLPAAAAAELARLRPPPERIGFTVFFTGLSGSGKSTVARALAARLLEIGSRRVTLLDGDVVRRNLSSELSFSREHRDLNIRRIGFVAAEASRHGGIAICAPIAPYDATRREVREMVERVGAFVLVHVATPIEMCEARDRKGLYARARSGDLPEFTGVSDPYEVPADAQVTIDTSTGTIDDAVDAVIAHLRSAGYLGP